MNKVILIGRLTKDPEIRRSSITVARFNLAVDRRFKREGEATADFISCVAFGKTAEFIEKYIRKGTKICVEGRIQTGSYEKDGVKHYTTDIVVENVEFAESKMASAAGDDTPQPAPVDSDEFMTVPDDIADKLPFK